MVTKQPTLVRGFPTSEGIYQATGIFGLGEPLEIKVVRDHGKLCCNSRDYAVDIRHAFYNNEKTNFNVPVNLTGLVFLTRIGDLPKYG